MTGSVSFSRSRFTLIIFTPVRLSTGRMPSSVPMAFSWIPNIFGMEGPVISASRIAVLCPFRLVSTDSRPVTRLFPTPPLPLTTAITFFTLLNAFCASSRLSGLLRDAQSAPQLEQSCVHSDTLFHLSLLIHKGIPNLYIMHDKPLIVHDPSGKKQNRTIPPRPESCLFRRQPRRQIPVSSVDSDLSYEMTCSASTTGVLSSPCRVIT